MNGTSDRMLVKSGDDATGLSSRLSDSSCNACSSAAAMICAIRFRFSDKWRSDGHSVTQNERTKDLT